jgi:hypothetical protein
MVMSLFQNWIKRRQLVEDMDGGGDPAARFKSANDDDFADDYEHIQQELFKTVMSKYPDESIEFFNTLAMRGDEEVAALLKKVQKDKPNQMSEPRHSSEDDEVVPSSADCGSNSDGGGGQ